ncbi:MAG: DUF2093 domain-containing protein [Hyphomicrobium sp.]|nr:DUF2093 domain-containing protein [Hyphomicrobium sp.]
MNRLERLFGGGEARLKYDAGEFQVLTQGDHVRCAVTGERIALANLRYWSVDFQEAYVSPDASLRRHLERVAKEED